MFNDFSLQLFLFNKWCIAIGARLIPCSQRPVFKTPRAKSSVTGCPYSWPKRCPVRCGIGENLLQSWSYITVEKHKWGNLHGAFLTTSFTPWIYYIANNRSGNALVLTPCYLTFFSQVLKFEKVCPKQSIIVTVIDPCLQVQFCCPCSIRFPSQCTFCYLNVTSIFLMFPARVPV